MDDKELVETKIHLSDEDIAKIVDRVCDTIENRLYTNVGSGIVSLVWRGVLIVMIGLAIYGIGLKFHP